MTVRIEIDGMTEVVGEVIVEARKVGEERWNASRAVPVDALGTYEATFTSTVVPDRPHSVEIRARVLGTRTGTLLELGYDEPLVAEILSAPEQQKRDAIFAPLRKDADGATSDLGLIGWVGADLRLGTGSRFRGAIGLGLRVTKRTEVLVHVSVGPSSSKPAYLDGESPVVLGVEGAARFYTRDIRLVLWSPWIEGALGTDLRLPGTDPGAGLRAGVTWNFSGDIALDASLGGMFTVYRAFDREDRSAIGGAGGGLRIEARFGGGR